jgi:Caspase domain
LAYATAPGNVAEDGEAKADSNGLYTKFLLQELKKPQAKIEDVFKRVRLNVRQQSQGRQIPWESTSLEDDFYFDKEGSSKKDIGVGSASHKLQASLWETLKGSSDSAAIIEFLKIFPSGYFSELAQTRLDQISAPQVAVVNRPDNISAKVGQLRKPVLGDVKEFEQSVRDGPTFTRFVQRSEVVRISEDRVFYKEKFNSMGKPTDVLSEVDLQGNLIKTADIEFKDPTQFVPAEYKVGYKWRFGVRSYSQVTGEVFRDYEAKIVKLESIKTKLGEFNAFRIELKMRRSDGVTEESIRWVDPSYAGGIKSQRRLYNRGSLVYSHDSETISFTPGNKT